MAGLYNKDHRYTDDARELDERTDAALRELFNEFVRRGYSPREVSHVMADAVRGMELEAVL